MRIRINGCCSSRSGGKAFREKVWRLPEAGPTAKGRALVNLLPELGADTITTVLPLPQDETLWDSLHLVFATALGNVRRNRLSDFRNVRSSGLIAMKLDEGDRLIGVATCREGNDVLLATRKGRCIRFQLSDDTVRVFAGRDSSGVRGIRLLGDDAVISLSVLDHVGATNEERDAYLRIANAKRRTGNGNSGEEGPAAPLEGPAPEDAPTEGPEIEASTGEEPAGEGSSLKVKSRRRKWHSPSSASQNSKQRKSYCSPSPTWASASGRRPTSTASPAAAGRGLPTSPWRRVMAPRWLRPSRCVPAMT